MPLGKKSSAKKRKTNDGKGKTPEKKTASRKLAHEYKLHENFRGHCKEYGDPTNYPCGAQIYMDGHYRDCTKCDAMRFLLDSWHTANMKNTTEDHPTEMAPMLTYAGATAILSKMGMTMDDILLQDDNWNPYRKLQTTCKITGDKTTTSQSFVEVYEQLSQREKTLVLRPPLPFLDEIQLSTTEYSAVPWEQRKCLFKQNLMEYILNQALADQLISPEYVKKVAANYGVVEPTQANAEEVAAMQDLSGVNFTWVQQQLAIDVARGEIPLADYDYSPRLLYHVQRGEEEDIALPHPKNDRLSSNMASAAASTRMGS